MNHRHLALALGLVAALTFGSGCRRKKPAAPVEAGQPVAEEAKTQTLPPDSSLPVPPGQNTSVPVKVDSFQTSTEFEDLTKDFQLYCNYKKRVPTDINEFFRDQKIKPPATPPGTRLAIDPKERRIILVK